jgi:hypothetical protein
MYASKQKYTMNTCSLKVLDRTLSFLLADAEPVTEEWIEILAEYQSLANRYTEINDDTIFQFLNKKTKGFGDDDKRKLIQYLHDNVQNDTHFSNHGKDKAYLYSIAINLRIKT